MAGKRPWIGTSWKMNLLRAEAQAYAEHLAASPWAQSDAVQLFVVPSFPSIADVADRLRDTRVRVGGQNMHWEERGAWTGEVSPLMLADCGASIAEIGHSERRAFFGETDETVALKAAAAVRHGLLALVCIGESRDDFEAGRTADVLAHQVRAALSRIEPSALDGVVLAYEPIWSIGEKGIPAEPGFADEQHARIKALTTDLVGRAMTVLYGGSVNAGNCVALAGQLHIDGLFIGRAAWTAPGYLGIVDDVMRSLAAPT